MEPEATQAAAITPGTSAPLGATVLLGGVNFSVSSRHREKAAGRTLDREGGQESQELLPLHPDGRSGHLLAEGAGERG